jgi:hypothetical protein
MKREIYLSVKLRVGADLIDQVVQELIGQHSYMRPELVGATKSLRRIARSLDTGEPIEHSIDSS